MPTRREVAKVKHELRAAGRRFTERIAPVMASLSEVPRLRAQAQQATRRANHAARQMQALRKRIEHLENRVKHLEDDMREARQLNRHIAELTDVVQEVLLPATNRDDTGLTELLDKYADSF